MNPILSSLPKVDKLLDHPILSEFSHHLVLKNTIKKHLASLRQEILLNNLNEIPSIDLMAQQIKTEFQKLSSPSLKPLINATGISLQTNLGRSVFSPKIIEKITPMLSEYLNLEYDINKGERGERYSHLVPLLCAMFECEDGLIVNNNAAALMLIINTFAKDKEVIISRSELVEIGGSFRIPEVIKGSGGILCEVGASNKTHLVDYKDAISPSSAMIAKVHKSNFAQVGFCSEVEFGDLIKLAKEANLIDYFDLGSGFVDGFKTDEPSILDIMKLDPSLVSFSGDKLFGGTQAGIILGKKDLIAKLKKNHLLRALRIDKISLIILQETLLAHFNKDYELIPTISQLSQSTQILQERANKLLSLLQDSILDISFEVKKSTARAGGGSLPLQEFPSEAIAFKVKNIQDFSFSLRHLGLIHRIYQDSIYLDVFCITERHFKPIVDAIKHALDNTNQNPNSSKQQALKGNNEGIRK